MRKFILALLFPISVAFPADLFSIGVKGGVPFTDAVNTATNADLSYITSNKHWTLGPEVDLNLPFGLGVEVDALYRRVDYESTGSVAQQLLHNATTANAWDFPLLLKWRFAPGPIKPYVSVGPTFSGLTNLNQVSTFFTNGAEQTTKTSSPVELQRRFDTGFTLSGGLQLGAAGIRLSPEIRYTHWGWDTLRDVSGLLKTNRNQVDFLVGLTF